MPQPTIITTDATALVYEALNVSKTTYGTFDGSPLYKDGNIRDMVMQGDIEICKAIMRSPGHPRRLEYQLQRTITTPGVSVPIRDTHHHVGDIVRVDITRNDAKVVVGKTAPAAKITHWLLNPALYGGNECIDGYYDFADGFLIFTGTQAVITLGNIATHGTLDTTLFAPFEYKMGIVYYAVKELLKRDPAKSAAQAQHEASFAAVLSEIYGSNTQVPASTEYQKER